MDSRHLGIGMTSPRTRMRMVERLREQLSTEKLKDRLERMLAQSEAALAVAHGAADPKPRRARRAASSKL